MSLPKSRDRGRERLEGWGGAARGGSTGAEGDGLSRRSPGEEVSEGGAEQ